MNALNTRFNDRKMLMRKKLREILKYKNGKSERSDKK